MMASPHILVPLYPCERRSGLALASAWTCEQADEHLRRRRDRHTGIVLPRPLEHGLEGQAGASTGGG
jgi:hypothetical protein